jgi:hypothetical protein
MKPTTWLATLVTLALPHLGRGQVVTFDTVQFNPLNSFLVGRSVFEVAGGYLVFGVGGDSSGDVQSVRSLHFDTVGGLLDATEQMDRRYVDIGSFGPVTSCSSEGYAAGITSRVEGSSIDSLFLYRYDLNGIVMWNRFLVADTTMVIRKCIETNNGDFVLVGLHEYPKGAFMFRVTSTGDSIRFVNFGQPSFYAMSVVEDDTGDLYLAGFTDTSIPQFQFRSYLVKCTPEGEVIWWKARPARSGFNGVMRSAQGGVLCFGTSYHPQTDLPRVLLVRYSSSGTELWRREDIISADSELRAANFTNGFQQPDGSYILCGSIRNTQLNLFDKGMLYKFDQNGNEIWSRFYSHYSGLPVGYPQSFKDVKPTSDGGFILTGETNGPSPPNPMRLWLVKLDSMGCLVPGCHTVGVEEFESQLQSALHISPNPANEQFTVDLALPEGYRLEGTVQLLLLDTQGKEVSRQTLGSTTGHVRTSVDVGALPTGLYYVHLRDDVKWLAGGKVMVTAP